MAKKICIVEFDRFDNGKPISSLPTFEELNEALLFSFKELGYEISYKKNQLDPKSINILIGSHRLFYYFEEIIIKEDYYVFNLEPLDPRVYENLNKFNIERFNRYLKFLSKSRVIDYSYVNKNIISKYHNNVEIFSFGFFDFKKDYLKNQSNNQFIFYGNFSQDDRREKIFSMLIKKQNLPIILFNDIWGLYRDNLIINSKGIFNIHRLDNVPLEIYRAWHCLSLGQQIISEKSNDKELDHKMNDYIHFIDNTEQINLSYMQNLNSKKDFRQTCFKDNLHNLIKRLDLI